jgi:hypothetical protein
LFCAANGGEFARHIFQIRGKASTRVVMQLCAHCHLQTCKHTSIRLLLHHALIWRRGCHSSSSFNVVAFTDPFKIKGGALTSLYETHGGAITDIFTWTERAITGIMMTNKELSHRTQKGLSSYFFNYPKIGLPLIFSCSCEDRSVCAATCFCKVLKSLPKVWPPKCGERVSPVLGCC